MKFLTNSLIAKFSDGIREGFYVFPHYISLTKFSFFSSGNPKFEPQPLQTLSLVATN
ncbi:hypothetical protein MTR_7g111270 [Medicago truncatula]|uniref:Uncharacterized protein n=1 Tax=Medicago truncatula TaxID=3880 RepID=G7KVJ9_MEDTR|nr:hypothetical protein MTR_7g111270 [Medicago truncatula]